MRRQGFESRRIFQENYTMNMNQLRYFIGVAEYQSFTKLPAAIILPRQPLPSRSALWKTIWEFSCLTGIPVL